MSKHKSFKVSDASFRDIPGFIVGYILISIFAVGFGLLLDTLPTFWSGVLCGIGIGLFGALVLLNTKSEKIDITELPEPSAQVRELCDDPHGSFAKAVKAYCDETGLKMAESVAVLKAYRGNN